MNASLRDRYDLAFTLYPYARSSDQDSASPVRHPVVIVGGGPVGLAAALDLGRMGVPVVVLDDHEGVGAGSRAICFAKRTLEICQRMGAAKPMLDKGIVWNIGKVFHDAGLLYEFNLLPEDGHRFPAFINLQQPYFEKFLYDAIRTEQAKGAPIQIRGKNRVDAMSTEADHSLLDISTPDGGYQIKADWIIACDGAGSPIRSMLGLDFEGRVFQDNFLIADVRMTAPFPTERWFWFEPHFKSGDSALLHKQPDDIWRIDFQLGWEIDREKELCPKNVRARVDAMLGPDIDYELVWTSIYTFQCRRMAKFRHKNVIFAGDSAHQVSPFGARGANSGIQDVDNLCWKLKMVLDGSAPERLLDSYHTERAHGADENILNSTRSTDFITPKSDISKLFRNAVLSLSADHAFARPLVNSGRLSVPCVYDGSQLNTADALPEAPMRARPGAPCPDAPLADGFLLDNLCKGFSLLGINTQIASDEPLHSISVTSKSAPDIADRYLGDAQTGVYLIRPDQHVAGRWPTYDAQSIWRALATATAQEARDG
jgi:3-(3-hydroxy-phenyl)propionate hydroxylase